MNMYGDKKRSHMQPYIHQDCQSGGKPNSSVACLG